MKVLAYVHGYLPELRAGAEAMLHEMLLDLRKRGHEAVVVAGHGARPSRYENIPVFPIDIEPEILKKLTGWADVIISHLYMAEKAMSIARAASIPFVQIIHNDADPVHDADLNVSNSAWLGKKFLKNIDHIVVHPPTKPERYEVDVDPKHITLINLIEDKGVNIFWELAKRMPERKFLGVMGGYGIQIIPSVIPKNVTILENTDDMKSVYSKTRILLVPSAYESWGRVSVEAACSGIPVIASKVAGPKESLGRAGIFADLSKIDEWVDAINSLDDPKKYNRVSTSIKNRAKELADKFDSQMDIFEAELLRITKR